MSKVTKTVLRVTILHSSDETLDGLSLQNIGYEIDEGAWLGQIETASEEEIAPEKVVAECEALGSDGTFAYVVGWLNEMPENDADVD